jgi:hypothetical protein
VPTNAPLQVYMNVINEWKISSTNANVVDPSSRWAILSFGKIAQNHNGGTCTFGPDGYMYLALGDGGDFNDVGASHLPGGNAQNLSTPLGKMLRFDPLNPALNPSSSDPISPNGQYRIPTSNLFQGGQLPEIYAYGLRNPYRFCFDPISGDLIEADVGRNNIEEINRILPGHNYGWAIKEGDFLFNMATGTFGIPPQGNRIQGAPPELTDPISGKMGTLEYDPNNGISITGGFVYRGAGTLEPYGKYIFGDLALVPSPVRINGRLFYADLQTGEMQVFTLPQFGSEILPNGLTVHGFGQDGNGEALCADDQHVRQWDRRGGLPAYVSAPDGPGDRQRAGPLLARRGRAPANADQQSGCWYWHQLGHLCGLDGDQSHPGSHCPGQWQCVLPAGNPLVRERYEHDKL